MNETLTRICNDARTAVKTLKGFTLGRGTYGRRYQDRMGDEVSCGCALTAIYVADCTAKCLSDEFNNEPAIARHIKAKYGVAGDVLDYFATGFDGKGINDESPPINNPRHREAYIAGYELGQELLASHS